MALLSWALFLSLRVDSDKPNDLDSGPVLLMGIPHPRSAEFVWHAAIIAGIEKACGTFLRPMSLGPRARAAPERVTT